MRGRRHDGWTDLFCGAGGASEGLVEAGDEVVLAANHWQTAIDTHSANHPDTEHLCKDLNDYNMRLLPRTRKLWASVICTEISPAAGKRRTRGQLDLLEEGPIDDGAFEATRATAYDVIRATEVHRYDVIVVENVPDFALEWELFGWWRQAFHLMGYTSQVVSVSSAHVGDDQGNDPAAQWRNRIYVQFSAKGIPLLDLAPRPLARCWDCGVDVRAMQAWNPGVSIGEYRSQYRYVCPNTRCRQATVEPYINPAASIIDWSDRGTRIGDRTRPLAPRTMTKIRDGLEKYATEPSLITVAHGQGSRVKPLRSNPLPTRTGKVGDGVLVPPGAFITELRGGGSTHRPVTHPLSTVSASGNHHGLVIPYRKGQTAYGGEKPLHTLTTRDSDGIVAGPLPADVDDAYFRMIQPREQLRAQRFRSDYIVRGNKGEQTMQAGNAVSVNVARWIGRETLRVLEGVS